MRRTFVSDLLTTIAERHRLPWRRSRSKPAAVSRRSITDLCFELLSRRGEASGTAIATAILERYRELDYAERFEFFSVLAERFGPDENKIRQAVSALTQSPSANSDLHFLSEPRRQELLRRLNRAPGGTLSLVHMRENLLEHLGASKTLEVVDRDFKHLFMSWFNRGFLVLRPIDWTTPVNILEKIIHYEAVHAIADWDDLRNRLKPADRRCYAFFHPQLADEPLIFVEVAMTTGVPTAIMSLLNHDRLPLEETQTDTATFYSISNTQKGLAGVNFGNFLIKQVVETLRSEMPHIANFVTLSPMPGFARWLKAELASGSRRFIHDDARLTLSALDSGGWPNDEIQRESVKPHLLALASSYLMHARNARDRPLDPVARFHLGNGAFIEGVNFMADLSASGLNSAHGMMVNYRYATDLIETNHEAYAENKLVVVSQAVRNYSLLTSDLVSAHTTIAM